MENVADFFENIPNSYRTALLLGGLTLFWTLESLIPLFHFQYSKLRHAGINLFFTLTTAVVNFLFAYLLLKSSEWAIEAQFGFIPLISPHVPIWIWAFLGLLGLDLVGAYLIHLIQHRIKFMWRFHIVHHTDTHVDTTTANRHHPIESVFRAVFTILATVLMGAPMWLVMLYQTLSAAFSQFNHANITLPTWLDRSISWLIVSPNMHKIHHHYQMPLTDTNYGNIFSIWDRIFGTFAAANVKELQYGLDTHMKPEEHSDITTMLKIPLDFGKNK